MAKRNTMDAAPPLEKNKKVFVAKKNLEHNLQDISQSKVVEGIKKSAGEKYDHRHIEKFWQERWQRARLDETDILQAKNPYYNLMMFPYPSAEGLHIGNMFAFTGADIYGRFKRMQGYDVFEPIGLDGFGIHSENYALKIGRHPMEHARITQKNYYSQLARIGAMFDWTKTVETYDPQYYRWTQWIFVQMFKHGLAYRGKANVNWCPSCKTVLADEQVVPARPAGGPNPKSQTNSKSLPVRQAGQIPNPKQKVAVSVCERCGSIVEKRLLDQWFFRITAYAEKLLANLERLDWSEKVKIAQQQWIGKKEGVIVMFKVPHAKISVDAFTTRLDTIFGVTFVALSPEYPLLEKLPIPQKYQQTIKEYINVSKRNSGEGVTTEKEKTGVFTGIYALNPVNQEKVPIWISNYVLTEYGTGAVMGVPAHDERDFEFARQFSLPIKVVVIPQKTALSGGSLTDSHTSVRRSDPSIQRTIPDSKKFVKGVDPRGVAPLRSDLTDPTPHWRGPTPLSAYTGFGMIVNSDQYSGCTSSDAIDLILLDLAKRRHARKTTTYHLRDWLISRQRYWGPPIPMVYCASCAQRGQSWFTSSEAQSASGNPKSLPVRQAGHIPARPAGGPHPKSPPLLGSTSKVGQIQNPKSNSIGNWKLEIGNSAHEMRGWYPVPEDDLPVVLPYIEDYKPGDDGIPPLAKHKEFYHVACPECGKLARRETEVSDTFLDSSWYFLRYPSVRRSEHSENSEGRKTGKSGHQNGTKSDSFDVLKLRYSEFSEFSEQLPWDPEVTRRWLPVDMYTGGAEHSVLHLMYSRFVWMAIRDWGYLDFSGKSALGGSGWDEPFTRFYAHGLIIREGAKMSKSKGNIVNPDEYIERYGADSLRFYLMFIGPFRDGGDFCDSAMEGMYRWVGRVWRLAMRSMTQSDRSEMQRALHKLVKKVTEDIEKRHYNTAIAAMMEFTNFVQDNGGTLDRGSLKTFILLLAPFAPYLAEELWQRIHTSPLTPSYLTRGKGELLSDFESIHVQPWPSYDPNYLSEEAVTVIFQVNGKLRGTVNVDAATATDQKKLESLAKEQKNLVRHLEGKRMKTVIFVPGKLINFVVG